MKVSSHSISENPLRLMKELVIKNSNGLHARPAALFVKTASRFQSEIWVEKEEERVNGKSIMGLMMLAAAQGTMFRVIAEGNDAREALQALEDLVETHFGEK